MLFSSRSCKPICYYNNILSTFQPTKTSSKIKWYFCKLKFVGGWSCEWKTSKFENQIMFLKIIIGRYMMMQADNFYTNNLH